MTGCPTRRATDFFQALYALLDLEVLAVAR